MSRLTDIIENHENLDQFFSIVKHYGVSAEFISAALIQRFEQEPEQSEEDTEASKVYPPELIDDLTQFCARF